MGKDVEAEINNLKESNTRLLAAITYLTAEGKTLRESLCKVAQQCGLANLNGVPIEQWIGMHTQKEIDSILLNLPNGQLAAHIQSHLAEVRKRQEKDRL